MAKLKTVLAVVGGITLLVLWKSNSPDTWDTFWSTVGSWF